MTKTVVKYNNSLKKMDNFTAYTIARNALIESGNQKQLEKMIEHMKTSKSQAETLKIIQMYVTFERE
jgi:ribosomal protein RSM22 (predicted rRNA methylase)